ncbi:hypothetical protein [Nioella sp. MMSF_3534]|uniref:hypothetical protein n=1 Tax=Nioella sp. MMSF_3534 TaxID=3046720 RepID=UPI00273EADB2|nr:hypothetical protein [Nioella sp. MMSF_3534]
MSQQTDYIAEAHARAQLEREALDRQIENDRNRVRVSNGGFISNSSAVWDAFCEAAAHALGELYGRLVVGFGAVAAVATLFSLNMGGAALLLLAILVIAFLLMHGAA